jgi:di/tricarboxylate transporter
MSDWTTEAAGRIEEAVGLVRDKAVVPAQNATKAVVYGLLAALFVIPAVILLSIGIFRMVDVYLPGGTWGTWFLFGGIFVVGGAFCWMQRSSHQTP